MAPAAIAKISQPISAVEACNVSRTAGVRDTQAARPKPQAANTTNMAFRQERTTGRSSEELMRWTRGLDMMTSV
jgi:hypothetical protein